MPFEKGKPRPPDAGRKPGSLNKKSLIVREILEQRGINLIEQILGRIPKLADTKDQVQALTQLLPYAYPKLSSITVEKTPEQEQLEQLTQEELVEKVRTIVLGRADYEKSEGSETSEGEFSEPTPGAGEQA